MSITTAYGGGTYIPKPKPFSWSYSKLKNYETCPKRHYNVDVIQAFKEEEGEALQWGNAVHKALANRIKGNVPLPEPMKGYEKWAEKVTRGGNTNILVEQQLAIDENFAATKWFDKDAERANQGRPWFRGIADVLKVNADGTRALAIDWKTGKVVDDAPQLALLSACIFAHHPNVIKVRSEFIWLKEDAKTRQDFERDSMPAIWSGLWSRIEQLKHAYETLNYPPKPGYLCRRYCPVTTCPHHGEE
jgi:hypothetical protein